MFDAEGHVRLVDFGMVEMDTETKLEDRSGSWWGG